MAAMTNVKLIKGEDVFAAMKATLPEERWHRTMNMTHVRPRLQERLNSLRGQLQQLEQEQKDQLRVQEEEDKQQAKVRQRADVFSPLVGLMADKLFKHLEPMMERYIEVRLNGHSKPDAVEAAQDVHRTVKQGKIRVGVVGLLGIQEQEVVKHFEFLPFVNFTFYDKDKGKRGYRDWGQNLDHIFLLSAKVDHGYETILDNFSRVQGRGTTAMIRTIEAWLANEGRGVKITAK